MSGQAEVIIAFRPEELVELLRAAGVGGVEVDAIRRHIKAGCPLRPDGRLDLIPYLAWLLSDESNPEPTAAGSAAGDPAPR